MYICCMEIKQIKTTKIEKGVYSFVVNGQEFRIVNNEGLMGFKWNCVHVESGKSCETKPTKQYLIMDLEDYLLQEFFEPTERNGFWYHQ